MDKKEFREKVMGLSKILLSGYGEEENNNMNVKELKEKINSIPEEHDNMNIKIKVINDKIGITFGGFSLAAENMVSTGSIQDMYIELLMYIDVEEPKSAAESNK